MQTGAAENAATNAQPAAAAPATTEAQRTPAPAPEAPLRGAVGAGNLAEIRAKMEAEKLRKQALRTEDLPPIPVDLPACITALGTLAQEADAQKKPTLAAALRNATAEGDGHRLRLTVGGGTDHTLLMGNREVLADRLRELTQNPTLIVDPVLDASAPEPPKVYLTATEALEQMRQQNPHLNQMLEMFDIRNAE